MIRHLLLSALQRESSSLPSRAPDFPAEGNDSEQQAAGQMAVGHSLLAMLMRAERRALPARFGGTLIKSPMKHRIFDGKRLAVPPTW